MIRSKLFLLFAIVSFATLQALAQSNLRPSKQYISGEELYGAKSGAMSVVPQGWSGMLPRDSELFLLLPDNGSNAEIYVAASLANQEADIKASMLAGIPLGNGNVLKSDGKIFKRGDNIASQLILTEATTNTKGYIEVQCGPYGKCITATLFSSPQDFESNKQALIDFMDALKWVEPNLEADYADFNWQEFLSGKHLLNYDYVPHAKAENDIWLCPDGTFTTKLKRSGLMKDQAKEYKGTKKGSWETTSVGKTGILVLSYQKLPPLEVTLKIEDDRIYLNDKRHFAMKATVCK